MRKAHLARAFSRIQMGKPMELVARTRFAPISTATPVATVESMIPPRPRGGTEEASATTGLSVSRTAGRRTAVLLWVEYHFAATVAPRQAPEGHTATAAMVRRGNVFVGVRCDIANVDTALSDRGRCVGRWCRDSSTGWCVRPRARSSAFSAGRWKGPRIGSSFGSSVFQYDG